MTKRQQAIIEIILRDEPMRSSGLHAALAKNGEDLSLVTVKRALSEMANKGILDVSGSGPGTAYAVSAAGRLFAAIDPKTYCAQEPDRRFGLRAFNFALLTAIPSDVFSDEETDILDEATKAYRARTADLSETIQKKELERLTIELSWKSSKIEGNTYTLLDTEKLILEHREAPGHDAREARMILNHKNAFAFVHDERAAFRTLTRANLERLHAILIEGLNVKKGLRGKPVGVLGSTYRPLDNVHQIGEAVDTLIIAVNRAATGYDKALIALAGISYIQPFEDGNKRAGRLMANALLMAHGLAPLSYRSVDENTYREAILVFYEINSIMPIKKIFVEQYDFAARNYAVR